MKISHSVLYVISLLVVIWGALNIGITSFIPAIPFMILLISISRRINSNKYFLYFNITICFFVVIFNLTIHKNPLIFPILVNGYVEVQKDGYHVSYSDGSGGFFTEEETKLLTPNICEGAQCMILKPGERYKVTGISINHPDFGTAISIDTEIGQFSEYNYKYGYIKFNKKVYIFGI